MLFLRTFSLMKKSRYHFGKELFGIIFPEFFKLLGGNLNANPLH